VPTQPQQRLEPIFDHVQPCLLQLGVAASTRQQRKQQILADGPRIRA
jgi:hypothetical protein